METLALTWVCNVNNLSLTKYFFNSIFPCSGSLSSSTKEKNGEKLTFAKSSCPDELDLCPSSTGFKLGIRTKQVIPEGTWMGPYQGNLVKTSDVTAGMDTSYMWEVSKLSFY